MNPDELTLLAVRYLDDSLTADERAAFEQALRTDSEARHTLNLVARQGLALADLARAEPVFSVVASPKRGAWPRTGWRWSGLAAAASVVAAGFLAALVWRGGAEKIVTLAQLSGAASWTGAGGSARAAVRAGDRLAAGTLETEEFSGTAELRFADGTTVTLGGGAELAFSEDGRKQLTLRRGDLTAHVTPQRAGQPLLLRTPTAEMEVLGTVFSVTAEGERTSLNVAEGRVKMRRLADGREVEVTADREALATLDGTAQFAASVRPESLPGWRVVFAEPPTDVWEGRWVPAEGGRAAHLVAEPYRAGWKADGTMSMRYGVIGSFGLEASAPHVRLDPGSRIKVRWRTASPRKVSLFLSTSAERGRFSGNFEAYLDGSADSAAPGEWRETTVNFADMKTRNPGEPTEGTRTLKKLLVSIDEAQDGLEVAEIRIEPGAGGSK